MIINCKHCNKEFDCENKRYNYSRKNNKNIFCSAICYNSYKKEINNVKQNCAKCGKEVIRHKSQLSKSKTGNLYCNTSCAVSNNNKLFKTGSNHPNYKNAGSRYRNKALLHYDHICMDCGNDDYDVLEVHHIDQDRSNNKLDNLCVICANCHLKRHKNGKR